MTDQTSVGEWREEALCMRLGLPTDIFFRGADVRPHHRQADVQELSCPPRVSRRQAPV